MKSKIRNNALKIGLLFLVITALVLGLALPALAQPVGPAAKLAFTTSPRVSAPGMLLRPQPVITVQDANGVKVTTVSGNVTLAIGTNPSGGILSGTLTANIVNGVASFSGLSLDKAGNGYTLVATSGNLTSVTSSSFNIIAAIPSPPKPNTLLRTIQGNVVNLSSNQFSLQSGNQTQETVNVDQDTKYFVVNMGRVQNYVNNQVAKDNRLDKKAPGLQQRVRDLRQSHIPANWRSDPGWLKTFDKQAQFSDIQVGDRVIVRATNDATPLAKQVLIVKAPVIQQVKGTITAISNNSITLTPTNGIAVTLSWDGSTRFVLKGLVSVQNGQLATAVYDKNTLKAQLVNVLPAAPN